MIEVVWVPRFEKRRLGEAFFLRPTEFTVKGFQRQAQRQGFFSCPFHLIGRIRVRAKSGRSERGRVRCFTRAKHATIVQLLGVSLSGTVKGRNSNRSPTTTGRRFRTLTDPKKSYVLLDGNHWPCVKKRVTFLARQPLTFTSCDLCVLGFYCSIVVSIV